jgi:ribulose bisphosphate carboxylase small subunit
MNGIQFGKIVARKGNLKKLISKDEIRKMLEKGWYVGVEFCVEGKSGWIVIDERGIDVLALDRNVINFLKEREEEVLEMFGIPLK